MWETALASVPRESERTLFALLILVFGEHDPNDRRGNGAEPHMSQNRTAPGLPASRRIPGPPVGVVSVTPCLVITFAQGKASPVTDRYLPQEPCDIEDILYEKVVEREHVWLLDSKEDIVGEILNDFGYEQKPPTHFFGWRRRHKAFYIRRDDGRTEEAEEDKSPDRRVLGVREARLDGIDYLRFC